MRGSDRRREGERGRKEQERGGESDRRREGERGRKGEGRSVREGERG